MYPQPLINYINEIKKSFSKLNLKSQPELLCEPGRALVAESGSTIVRVNLRKKQNFILMMELTVHCLMLAHLNLFFLLNRYN